jgi:hypothetical protein
MMKANEGRDCDGSLESPLPGEDEGTAGEGPSARDAVTGIVRRRKGESVLNMLSISVEISI